MQLTLNFDPTQKRKEASDILRRLSVTMDDATWTGATTTVGDPTYTGPTADAAPEAEEVHTETEDKPRRGRKPKQEAAPAEEEETQEEFDLDGEEEAEEAKHTLQDVIAGFQKYAKDKGKEKAHALLKKAGVKSVREIPEAKYAEVMLWLTK